MPTPISRVEVTVASASVSPIDPANVVSADRGFTVFDPFSGFGVHYALQCSLLQPLGVGQPFRTVYTAAAQYPPTGYVGDVRTPASWNTIQLVPSGTLLILTAADGGASYQAGGTIAIEKDWDGFTITFFTPLGNMVMPLDTVTPGPGPAIGNFSEAPSTTGFWHSMYWVGATDPVLELARWKNFYWSVGGVHVDGAALTSANPGFWEIVPDPFESQIPNSNVQEALDYLTEFHATVPANDFFARATEYRQWMGPSVPLGLDMTTMPEHDIVFAVWEAMPAVHVLRRSHDHGHAWTDLVVGGVPGGESVTVQGFAGQVWVCYYDGTTSIVTRHSADFGLTWSSPVPVSITGTNPRLVIAPEGTFFYFYFSGTNLVLSRSNDFGVTLFDVTPIPITASLTAQDFGAVLAADRSLVVSYINSGNWESKRSRDWGNTWALA
jgi:hypothetical protein